MGEKKLRYSEDKPRECKYCYWYKSKKQPCLLEVCHYLIPEREEPKTHIKGQCDGCPYGKDLPCIGYCIVKILQEIDGKDRNPSSE